MNNHLVIYIILISIVLLIILFGIIFVMMLHFMFVLKLKHRLYKTKLVCLSKLLDKLVRIIWTCDIPASVEFGEDCVFAHHGLGIVIHPKSKLGKNCKIFQNVTIGHRNGSLPPIIGDNVYIGTGSFSRIAITI